MRAPPAISVVLPYRNAAQTLAEAIESICNQTVTDWELLLYDDGSDDTSRFIAAKYVLADSRIRIVGDDRVGVVAALQRTCAEARGEFIARMDADDVSYPSRFEQQLKLMRDTSIALCGCEVRSIGSALGEGGQRYHEWLNSLSDHESIEREIFVECPIAHPTFFMRRGAFDEAGGYEDNGWAEDYDLVLRLWRRGATFAKVPEPLLDWRNSTQRLSQTDVRYALERFIAAKLHYLDATILRNLGARRFYQWGAGEVGKRWLGEWDQHRPTAVVDIHPRKIGTKIHGYRVIAPDDLAPPDESYILIAVGAPGARGEIRASLDPRGYREGIDYRFVA